MAIKLADTARPNNYVDREHLGTFPVAYAEDVWFEDGTRLSEKTFDGHSIQVTELPPASADELGNIYQYIGTSGTYQHGCFYECVNDSDSDYEWKELRVIKNAIVYTDTEPTIGEYTEGSVIVYSGENTNAYKKGHHYKYVVGEPHTLNLFTGENVTIPATTYLRVLEDELVVGAHTYNEAGGNSGYIISVGEDSVEYYSYYYSQVMTVTNIQKGASSTINITDYLDIGGGGDDGNDYEEFVGTQAEWDALSQSQKNKYDGKIVNITDDDGGANLDYYSTSETKTNKVWIDGKPIYRKVYKCTAATTLTAGEDWKNVAGWDIDVSDMAVITYLFGSTHYWGRIDWSKGNNNKLLWCSLNSTITVVLDAALTIEYTKLAD